MIGFNDEKKLLLKVIKDYLDGTKSIASGDPLLLYIDWNAFYTLAAYQKVLPIVYHSLYEVLPSDSKMLFKEKCEYIRNKNQLIFEEVKKLTTADKKNKHMFFLKGIVLSQILYDDPFLRKSDDIDILINENYLGSMDKVLKELGFVQACGKTNVYSFDYNDFEVLPYPILKSTNSHEYFGYYKMSESEIITIELQRAIHETISAENIEGFLEKGTDVRIKEIEVQTLDLVHTILYLTESIHTDAGWYYRGPRLNKYLELALFINKFEQEIDWNEINQKAQKYEMVDIVNDIFEGLNVLFDMVLPKINIALNEIYKIEKLFSIEWDTPLVERLFQSSDERQAEIFRKLKTQCYTKEASSNIIQLEYYNESLPRKMRKLDVSDGKEVFDFEYCPVITSENLEFIIYIPKEIRESYFDWEVHLNLIDSCIESEVLDLQTFTFVKRDGVIQTSNSIEGKVDLSCLDLSEVRIIIPLSIVKFSKDGLLAYKIIVRKRIYGEIYYSISSDGYSDKNFWLSPYILKLPEKKGDADDTSREDYKAL